MVGTRRSQAAREPPKSRQISTAWGVSCDENRPCPIRPGCLKAEHRRALDLYHEYLCCAGLKLRPPKSPFGIRFVKTIPYYDELGWRAVKSSVGIPAELSPIAYARCPLQSSSTIRLILHGEGSEERNFMKTEVLPEPDLELSEFPKCHQNRQP